MGHLGFSLCFVWTLHIRDRFDPPFQARLNLQKQIYTPGASVCILKKDGTTTVQKTNQLSSGDQRYLTANPPQDKSVFDPEEEKVALNQEIDDLTNRLTALESARKRGSFHGTTETDGAIGTVQGSYSEGPSKGKIARISATLLDRKAKLSALKAAFKLKESQ